MGADRNSAHPRTRSTYEKVQGNGSDDNRLSRKQAAGRYRENAGENKWRAAARGLRLLPACCAQTRNLAATQASQTAWANRGRFSEDAKLGNRASQLISSHFYPEY